MMRPTRPARVERGERVLEHHLHAPALGAQPAPRQLAQIAVALEQDAAAVRLDQPTMQQRPSVDLPEPDSPTSAQRLAAAQRRRLTPATACTTLRLQNSAACRR